MLKGDEPALDAATVAQTEKSIHEGKTSRQEVSRGDESATDATTVAPVWEVNT